jgi:hypothetical protein
VPVPACCLLATENWEREIIIPSLQFFLSLLFVGIIALEEIRNLPMRGGMYE